MNLLAYVTTIAFALSLIANALERIETDNSVGLLVDLQFCAADKGWHSRKLCQYRKIHLLYPQCNRSFICLE